MTIQELEVVVLEAINVNRNRDLDGFFTLVTDTAFYVAFGIPVVLILVKWLFKKVQLNKRPYFLLLVVSAAGLFTTLLKHIIDRPRPFKTYDFIEKISSGGSPSFPSGHSTDAFAIATALLIAYPRWYFVAPAYVWAFTVAYSRMFVGVHYLSDVLAGMTIGILMAFAGKALLKKKLLAD